MKFFSYKDRPVHLGPFPLETLKRTESAPDLSGVPAMTELDFSRHDPDSIAHAIKRYLAMLDITRSGMVMHESAEVPDDHQLRTNHLKAAGYYFDASMIGACEITDDHLLKQPITNPEQPTMAAEIARGIPPEAPPMFELMHPLLVKLAHAPEVPFEGHTRALVFLIEFTREPGKDEPGTDWIRGTQTERAALLAANTASLIAEYIRLLGYDARAHTATASDVDLNKLAVSAGLAAAVEAGESVELINPFVGSRFGLAAVTTNFTIAADRALGPNAGRSGLKSHGPKWWLGIGQERRADNAVPYADREFHKGPYPFEKIKRVDKPTTFLDEERIPRVPKRADWFARASFGDLGKAVQAQGLEYFIGKNPIGACALKGLISLMPLQYGEAREDVNPRSMDAKQNALNLKAACYYLAADAVGLSRVPDWTYYSHDSKMQPITPYHDNGVSIMFDQGHETMEGASGDDWISSAQSMRAYLRFSLLGGVIGEQVRRQGYSARVHTVLDGEVLQPPLMLLSGLGEISRIGDVMLNPYLGPRLKSGVVTTSMPMEHDKPIDFGLQNFCENCQKCARECPSGSITVGPKVMYNGYEVWRSDAEKCSRYRITNFHGAMCGRCMKTCPWNLEGLFTDSAFRWMAINAPASAKTLAQLDDKLGRGAINPVKKWWWDVELNDQRDRFVPAKHTNARELQPELILIHEEQSLAAYTADMVPGPFPVTQAVDRDAGIKRYRELLSPEEYKQRLAKGNIQDLVPEPAPVESLPPAFPVKISKRTNMTDAIAKYELSSLDGRLLPSFEAGAHLSVVVTAEIQREYSLAGDPADQTRYVLGIQRESDGSGSQLIHKLFQEGRTIFVTPPTNHFPLDEDAKFSLLMAGGIGITPMIAMAHRLHALGKEFILHFSAKSTEQSGFARELKAQPWGDRAFFHFSQEGTRADMGELVPDYRRGFKLYTCGGERYMDSVFDSAQTKGWPENALSREYFSVPELPVYEDHPFTLELFSSKQTIEVPAEKTAAEALEEAGIHVDTQCCDGICGVCVTRHLGGEIEHRDFVLSNKEREQKVILCCSRAKEANGVVSLAL